MNWFNTLSEALASESLEDSWDCFKSISYGENARHIHNDGTRFGHLITIYRSTTGMYERPVHYSLNY